MMEHPGENIYYITSQSPLAHRKRRPGEGSGRSHALCTTVTEGIMHRDLKMENILVEARGNVNLCNFSLGGRFTAAQKLDTICGTLLYHAPELYWWEEYDVPVVDIRSLAALPYFMVMRCFPFSRTIYVLLKEPVFFIRSAFLLMFPPKCEASSVNF
ncbi:Hypothetical predicted protein [Marmota monax]|uniref:non-specific serine/threonine protein kinase n=1 Tax=Marmota monax TaxID=9995 RepID=A0A5E4BJ74_MARMO|nr:Hypothetical predicted protein [Marmota monax]